MAVKVVIEGQVADLHRLTNITVFPLVVTVYSDDTQLVNNLSGIVETEALDISGISEDVSARLRLNLPENVSLVGDQSVLVKVSVEAILSSLTISEKALEVINLDPALAAELSSLTVDVIVSGPLPALDALSADDLRVILDAEGLGVGVHQLVPVVEILDEDIQVETILPESIELTLSIAPLATPTALP
jgi:YbbR domain-containing protein